METRNEPLKRNLVLFRLQNFLFGLFFWYGIEQLFINSIGGGSNGRGIIIACFLGGMIVSDVPTGILADKKGRVFSMQLSAVLQVVSVLLMGLSRSVGEYAAVAALFGFSISLRGGAYEALLYDTLHEAKRVKDYAKEAGGNFALSFVGATIANLLSGPIANHFGLRWNYFLTLIPASLVIVVCAYFVEPSFHKDTESTWRKHGLEAYRSLVANPKIFAYALSFILVVVVFNSLNEFGQLYFLSYGVSAVGLGILWAGLAAAGALGNWGAHYLQKYPIIITVLFVLGYGSASFIHARSMIVAFFIAYAASAVAYIFTQTEVQHTSDTKYRAATLSLLSFSGNALAIPFVVGFGWLGQRHSIAAPYKVTFVLTVLCMFAIVVIGRRPAKNLPGTQTSMDTVN